MALQNITVPLSPSAKKYMIRMYGKTPRMTRHDHIGKKFFELIERKSWDGRYIYRFDESKSLKFFADLRIDRRHPPHFGHKSAAEFSAHIENHVADIANWFIYGNLHHTNSIKEAILLFMDKFNFEESELPYETIKKRFYRWEKSMGYGKKFA
ncbi:hypothetical protein FUAX_55730 (plasmid) [Fulvitalea axinellae]|uniref:Uncharacterized protein n=1 Tax=Fulvitalea axinellae TaxID=1182444 RepID=A0AAU9CVP9_9BACT|nr:hypothetical protein FUAX_55730 [Fulvitalea axinellae]